MLHTLSVLLHSTIYRSSHCWADSSLTSTSRSAIKIHEIGTTATFSHFFHRWAVTSLTPSSKSVCHVHRCLTTPNLHRSCHHWAVTSLTSTSLPAIRTSRPLDTPISSSFSSALICDLTHIDIPIGPPYTKATNYGKPLSLLSPLIRHLTDIVLSIRSHYKAVASSAKQFSLPTPLSCQLTLGEIFLLISFTSFIFALKSVSTTLLLFNKPT